MCALALAVAFGGRFIILLAVNAWPRLLGDERLRLLKIVLSGIAIATLICLVILAGPLLTSSPFKWATLVVLLIILFLIFDIRRVWAYG
ncbi:hypothetical protein KBC03_08370 [Patescibacteria group bacterium]|nr:hypothetical protein [Patescibacteria group bacterium]